MPLPASLARFNRVATNRVMRPVAGRLPMMALLLHVGRTSGHTYRTPVNCWLDDQAALVPLAYGRDTDWMKNVDAAGGGVIVARGREHPVGRPVVVGPEAAELVPGVVRLFLIVIDAAEFAEFPLLSPAPPT